MNKDILSSLLYKRVAGTLTAEEAEELSAYFAQEDNREIITTILQEMALAQLQQPFDTGRFLPLLDVIFQADKPRKRIIKLQRWIAAASILLLLGTGIYSWLAVRKTDPAVADDTTAIQPGREGAILTLADGSQVQLDTIRNGTVALQEGVTAKVKDGQLVYEGHTRSVVYNTMTTPKGRQFQLTLPDGSKVWLNAASSIHYPLAFAGNIRKVKVSGEVYIDVAKNSAAPFVVDIDGKQTVEVLGTQFNINSYEDESGIATTLLEGSVKVINQHQHVILMPGEQAFLADGQQLRIIRPVNTEQVTAWRYGVFNFTNQDVVAIFRQLSRWYDIDVRFEGKPPSGAFKGKMSRNLPLSELLKFLQVFGLQFKLEGKTLIIKGE